VRLSDIGWTADEALKLGDKVSILEGGAIVQTGTETRPCRAPRQRIRRRVRAPRESLHRDQGRLRSAS
jgi:ABC-type proline/glycine betaine transport system ATPase subunit